MGNSGYAFEWLRWIFVQSARCQRRRGQHGLFLSSLKQGWFITARRLPEPGGPGGRPRRLDPLQIGFELSRQPILMRGSREGSRLSRPGHGGGLRALATTPDDQAGRPGRSRGGSPKPSLTPRPRRNSVAES